MSYEEQERERDKSTWITVILKQTQKNLYPKNTYNNECAAIWRQIFIIFGQQAFSLSFPSLLSLIHSHSHMVYVSFKFLLQNGDFYAKKYLWISLLCVCGVFVCAIFVMINNITANTFWIHRLIEEEEEEMTTIMHIAINRNKNRNWKKLNYWKRTHTHTPREILDVKRISVLYCQRKR